MKHCGDFSRILRTRDDEIVKTYYRIRRRLPYPFSQMDICKLVSIQPASRFFIPEVYASIFIAHPQRFHYTGKKLELYRHFIETYERVRRRNPRLDSRTAMFRALFLPAIHFGISPMRIRIILLRRGIR